MIEYSGSIGIKYVSLLENSGYGNAAKRYMRGLIKLGVPLTWTPMVSGSAWELGYEPFPGNAVGDPEFDQFCNLDIPYDCVIVHTVPEYFPHWARLEQGKHLIGYTVWETDIIPQHWKPLLNTVDGLMVPCQWNREVFQKCGVTTPIAVIPHTLDDEHPQSGSQRDQFSHSRIKVSDFVFYSINAWTPRKALWDTLEAYLEAFSSSDPVVLVIKTTEEDFSKPLFKLPSRFVRQRYAKTRTACDEIISRYPSPARVALIDHDLAKLEIAGLHERGDCYVSLCRTEGWGMGAFDACHFGNPVIMTAYGGQLDFLPPSLAFLVNYKPVAVDYHPHFSSYTPDQHWAKVDVKDGARWMRHVYEHQNNARERGSGLQQHVMEHFDPDRVCRQMLDIATQKDRGGS
jgi:glycosyltransferase involved in cell wall biosynthesis